MMQFVRAQAWCGGTYFHLGCIHVIRHGRGRCVIPDVGMTDVIMYVGKSRFQFGGCTHHLLAYTMRYSGVGNMFRSECEAAG